MSVLVLGGATVAGVIAYRTLTKDLPQLAELEHYQPSLVTKIYARDGELLGDFFIERRFLVPLQEIPLHVRQATIAVEDARFYSHSGVDFLGVLRALWVNFRAGEVKEGASTITQQVARSLFLTRERTLARKLREAILAYRIEQRFSKDQILEMYLNQIFYGHNIYGVEAAAQVYFGKSIKDMTLAEGALIAGLPSAPNRFSPLKDVALSMKRREHVLRRMLEEGYISAAQAHTAQQETVQLSTNNKPQVSNKGSYFVEYVRQYIEERYGATALYRGGFQVYTTLDLRLQQAAERAMQHGIVTMDKRHGYRGARQRLLLTGNAVTDAALVTAVTLPADSDPTIREGETLPGVVLRVSAAEATVAVKTTHGILPREGVVWVRTPDLHLEYQNRRAPPLSEVLRRGDVIRVRVVQVDTQW